MRQKLSKIKIDKLKLETGLDIVKVLVRGGTDHRKDLCLSDGSIIYLYKDGTMEKTNYRYTNWNTPSAEEIKEQLKQVVEKEKNAPMNRRFI